MNESSFHVVMLPGDGIGPEVMKQAMRVLEAVRPHLRRSIEVEERWIGGAAIDRFGVPLPQETQDACLAADAVLLAAVGGPKWDSLPVSQAPEAGLLGLRKAMAVFANLRPAVVYPALADASPLKRERVDGVDLLVVRELTGGLYYGPAGRKETTEGEPYAYNTMRYTQSEVQRVAHTAFKAARQRRHHVTSVDKANVLEVSRFWREEVTAVAKEYPDVTLDHLYVDNAAMQLATHPGQFDVLLAENTFGDILSDEAAAITGSLGLLPSASLGEGARGFYEPVHGSAPDIAGKGTANPIAQILSLAMLLRYSAQEIATADAIEAAVRQTIAAGYRTPDIAQPGEKTIGTQEMGDAVLEALNRRYSSD